MREGKKGVKIDLDYTDSFWIFISYKQLMEKIIKKLNRNSRSHTLIYQMLQKQCQANYRQHFQL